MTVPSAVRIVALDLGGVVVDVDKAAPARALGLSAQAVDEAFFGARRHDEVTEGLLDGEAFIETVAELLERPPHVVRRAWASMVRVRDDAFELLTLLSGATELSVSLWSNTDPIHFDTLASSLPPSFVDGPLCTSFHVGAQKPDPRFFEGALRRLSARPEDVVFFDDRAENVRAARSTGIAAVAARSPADVLGELQRLGLL